MSEKKSIDMIMDLITAARLKNLEGIKENLNKLVVLITRQRERIAELEAIKQEHESELIAKTVELEERTEQRDLLLKLIKECGFEIKQTELGNICMDYMGEKYWSNRKFEEHDFDWLKEAME